MISSSERALVSGTSNWVQTAPSKDRPARISTVPASPIRPNNSGKAKPEMAAPIRPPATVIAWATARMRVGASSTP